MRWVILVLVLIGVAGVFTKPSEAVMQAAADAKLAGISSNELHNGNLGDSFQNNAAKAAAGKRDDFLVAVRFSEPANEPRVQCWGALQQAPQWACFRTRATE